MAADGSFNNSAAGVQSLPAGGPTDSIVAFGRIQSGIGSRYGIAQAGHADRGVASEVTLAVAQRFEMPVLKPIFGSTPQEQEGSYEWQ